MDFQPIYAMLLQSDMITDSSAEHKNPNSRMQKPVIVKKALIYIKINMQKICVILIII